jgi:hypothetical protein
MSLGSCWFVLKAYFDIVVLAIICADKFCWLVEELLFCVLFCREKML